MTIDSDNWQLLQDLFHLAEATPEPDRERVLCERCSDGALRQRAVNIFNAFVLDAAVQGDAELYRLLRKAGHDFRK